MPEEKQFSKTQFRFGVNGVCLNSPVDAIPKGKVGFIRNLRPDLAGSLQTRPPIAPSDVLGSDPLNSLKTLVDDITGISPLIVGNTTGTLWLSNPPVPGMLLESGYSGKPLTWAQYQPLQATRPFLYIGDSLRIRKVDSSGNLYNVGIEPPALAPGLDLAVSPGFGFVESLSSTSGWAASGTGGTIASAERVPAATTITRLIFDNGGPDTSWASVTFNNPHDWLGAGTLITVDGEVCLVESYLPQAFDTPTSIAAIQYDVGATGLCCVVLDSQTAALAQDSILTLGTEDV